MKTFARARPLLPAAAILASAACTGLGAACGSSPGGSTSSAAFGPQTYTADDVAGSITRVTFTDATHYSLGRSTCTERDTGCTESGTYLRDDAAGTVSFTRTDGTFYTTTLSFAGVTVGPATGDEVTASAQGASGDDDDDGGSLTPQDITSAGDASLLGSGGALTLAVGTPIVQTFTLDGHPFASTPLVVADGGPLVIAAPGNWLPTVVDQAGLVSVSASIMTTPTVVTVTWSADPSAQKWEQFLDALGPSAYWSTTAGEYGVGAMTVGPHVRLTSTPPTNLTSDTIGTWINSQISAARSAWPKPTGSTYYALFLPQTTSDHLQEDGESACDLFDGEHDSATYKGTPYAYAIMLQCSGSGGDDDDDAGDDDDGGATVDNPMDDVTASASHELVEGCADPWMKHPGYTNFDSTHLAWDLLQNFESEVSDACENFPSINSTFTTATGTWAVQRIWSNAQARAGHDPCVPAPAGPYFTVAPMNMVPVHVKTPEDYDPPNPRASVGATLPGMGYSIKVGSSAIIPLQLVSDVSGTGP